MNDTLEKILKWAGVLSLIFSMSGVIFLVRLAVDEFEDLYEKLEITQEHVHNYFEAETLDDERWKKYEDENFVAVKDLLKGLRDDHYQIKSSIVHMDQDQVMHEIYEHLRKDDRIRQLMEMDERRP